MVFRHVISIWFSAMLRLTNSPAGPYTENRYPTTFHTGTANQGGQLMLSLSKVHAGESCTIKWMLGNVQVIEFLRNHNMKEGSLIRVLHQGCGGTIISMDDRRFALSNEAAERIKV